MHFVEPHAIDKSIVLGVSEKKNDEEMFVFLCGHLGRTGNSDEAIQDAHSQKKS